MDVKENQPPQVSSSLQNLNLNLNLQNHRESQKENLDPIQHHNSAQNHEFMLQNREFMLQNHEFLSNLEQYIEKITGYRFTDPDLLMEAFTDSSLKEDCSSYERLEYVGDSVLNLLIANYLYLGYRDLPPGKLTRLRAANVDTEKLARVALKYNLHLYLRHKKPLLSRQIEEFKEAIVGYPLHSSGLVDAPKVLADIVEALIGAIFIDSGSQMDTTWKVVKNLLQPIISPSNLQTHPVTKLYEICQKKRSKVKIVDSWKETGEIEVYVDDEFAGKAKYSTKRLIAINRAANNAYNKIVEEESCLADIN